MNLFNFQFPESRKIFFCWNAEDVRPKSEIHSISDFKNLNFQPHKIYYGLIRDGLSAVVYSYCNNFPPDGVDALLIINRRFRCVQIFL